MIARPNRTWKRPLGLRQHALFLAAAWTLLVAALGIWEVRRTEDEARKQARAEALAHFSKEQAFWLWGASHGGVYVPPTERSQPSPQLTHLPDRDVETLTGKKLTLMNPADMLRQLAEEFGDLYDVEGRVTSLKPRRPENGPDDWERAALVSFEQGAEEAQEYIALDGEPHLRLMRPMRVAQPCLKCHGDQGYEVGDICGGMAVSVPTASVFAQARASLVNHWFALGVLWLTGLLGTGFSMGRLGRRVRERDQAEDERERSRVFLQAVVDQIPESLTVINRDHTIALANQTVRALAGGKDPVAAGLKCHQVLHGSPAPCDGLEAPCPIEQVVATKAPMSFEHVHRDARGHTSTVEIIAAPVLDGEGEVVQVIESCRNITERRRLEQELSESHTLLEALIEQSPLPMAFATPTGELTFNPACADHLQVADDANFESGLNLYEMQRTWTHYDTEGNPLAHADLPLVRALQGKSTRGLELRVVLRDGSEKWEIVNAAPIYDDKSELIAGLVVFPDITERKRAEEEKLSLERQVQHAQKLESLGVLAGGIAHDFNNLLMAILGNADLVLNEISPRSPAHGKVQEIERASKRAAGLAQQMLAYSGKGRFVVESIDAGELVEEMAHLLEVSLSKKAVLEYDLAEDLPTFDGDVTQIRQVVMNLITNASEAIGDRSGVIALSTGAMNCDRAYLEGTGQAMCAGETGPPPAGRYTYFEVADTGCGMDAGTVERLFDPFFTTKFTGRGLGMSAVLGIVRGHQGVLKVHSEVGTGTTFRVLFPASTPSTAKPVGRSEGVEETKDLPVHGTVLLVDDEETIRAVGRQMLERIGFGVLTANDGSEALEVLREHVDEVVCVLLDLTMPRMDGVETFAKLRRRHPDISVVLCSGYNEHDATRSFGDEGLAGFIQKPFNMASLRANLTRVLSGATTGEKA